MTIQKSTSVSVSLAAAIALSIEDAQTIEINTPLLLAAVAIDGAKASAKAIIGRALSNDCAILLSLLNSASGDDKKALNAVVKNYVADLSAPTANPEYTIMLDKTLGYVWQKRDPKVLARQKLIDAMEELNTEFNAIRAWSLPAFDYVYNLKSTSEADCKRKLTAMQSLADLAKLLNVNEPALTLTDNISVVRTDLANVEEWNNHSIEAIKLVINSHITAANEAKKTLNAKRAEYTKALNSLAAPLLTACGLPNMKKDLETLPAGTIQEMNAAIGVISKLSTALATMKEHKQTAETLEIQLVNEGEALTVQAVTDALILKMSQYLQMIAQEKAIEDAKAATAAELEATHNEQLKDLEKDTIEQERARADLAELSELEENCVTFGLGQHYDHLLTLTDRNAYKRQLNAMITHVSDIEDIEEQNEIAGKFEMFPVELKGLKDAYGDYILAFAKSKTKDKPKTLTSLESQVNEDSQALARQVLSGLGSAVDALLTKHSELNASRDSVLIALYQQLGQFIEESHKTRESGKTKGKKAA